MSTKPFQFKQFVIEQDQCMMKIGTDGVLLGAWIDVSNSKSILDIGTGTGVIAIMAAQRTEDAIIHGVEIDEAAFVQAQSNMNKTPWKDRLTPFHQSIQDFTRESTHKYDLIVSNPPFFSGGTLSDNLSRNEVRHTVKLPNGELLNCARRLLAPGGCLAVILPYIEGLRFQEQAESYGFYCNKITEVHPKAGKPVERLLLEFSMVQKDLVKEELIIQFDKRNDYTEDYITLTKEFYLNM